MKPRFSTSVRTMRGGIGLMLAMAIALPHNAYTQSHRWSAAASAGIAILQLGTIDDDNASDADGWARLGYPVSPFSSLKQAPVYSARVSYRIDREFAVSFLGMYVSRTVTASYHSADGDLDLSRAVTSGDAALTLSYYPRLRPFFLEWYFQATMGVTFVRASATATGTEYIKVGNLPTPKPLVDTDARFSKSKITVGAALGADVPIVTGVAIKLEALYRLAQFGILDGTVRRFDVENDASTNVEFNCSGFLLSAGVQISL